MSFLRPQRATRPPDDEEDMQIFAEEMEAIGHLMIYIKLLMERYKHFVSRLNLFYSLAPLRLPQL